MFVYQHRSPLSRVTLFLGLLCALLSLSVGAGARQPPIRLRTIAQSHEIEVGESILVRLSASVGVDQPLPQRPQMAVPPGLVLRGAPQQSTESQFSIGGGSVNQSQALVVTWRLEAQRPGRYRVGPPSVEWNGKRVEDKPFEVTVYPAGANPQRLPRGRGNPIDPFGGLDIFGMPSLPGLMPEPDEQPEQTQPPSETSLEMDTAPDRYVFLRALVDKQQAVLGEQVTLSIYEYFETGAIKQLEAHEPATPDYLQRWLLSPDDEPPIRFARVGGEMWRVRLIRKVALFPLRTGRLSIGPMELRFVGMGFRGATTRRSQTLAVAVSDAPAAGRPVGYRPGDVGTFTLLGQVEPRTVPQGGAVAVTIKLEGTGNLPTSLAVPARKGAEWLDPQVRESSDIVGDRVHGTRTFMYVVRLSEAGTVDLGELRLPYYDPDKKAYDVAVAPLGTVTVQPSATPAASASVDPAPDRFAAIGGVRPQLGSFAPASRPWTDRAGFWIALAAGPLMVLGVGAGVSVSRKTREKLSSWRTSHSRLLSQALQEANAAAQKNDNKGTAAAIERAVHLAIEASTGLKSRGILREQLAEQLTSQGLEPSKAEALVELLARCEQLRFDPQVQTAEVKQLLTQAEQLTGSVAHRVRRSS